jgi:hypothetical protein
MSQADHTVYVSTAMASNVDMPFRFLDLAPELRNHIYNFATSTFKRPVKLSHRPARTNDPQAQSVLALTQVCKQVRAEFQPLYMTAALIDIDLSDMEAFLSTFSPVTISGVFTSRCERFMSTFSPVIPSYRLLDMRSFFVTLAQTPKPRWRFWTGQLVSTKPQEWRMTQIKEALELAVTMPGSFLCAIASGFISGITFQQTQDDMHQKWVIAATKADGSGL